MKDKISQLLKNKRKELKFSPDFVVAELLKKGVKISPKTLYGYEGGNRQPDANTLLTICQVYKIENLLHELGHEIPDSEESAPSISVSSEIDKKIINKFLKLSERNKYKIEGKIDDYLVDDETSATSDDLELENIISNARLESKDTKKGKISSASQEKNLKEHIS